jgi:hypothetical protein
VGYCCPQEVIMKLLSGLIAMSTILCLGCAEKTSGEACDLGMGEYTEAVCSQAAAAAGCDSHQLSSKSDTMCSGKLPVTRTCCAYNSCSSQPTLPEPRFPACSP